MSQPYKDIPTVVRRWLCNEIKLNIEAHNASMEKIGYDTVGYTYSDINAIADNILGDLHEAIITPNVNNRFDIEEDC